MTEWQSMILQLGVDNLREFNLYDNHREEAAAYTNNPTTWDSRRGLKRSWSGELAPGPSSANSKTGPQDKPSSSEKGKNTVSYSSQYV